MVKSHIHIIGGGLAGLSSAVFLSHQQELQINLHEGSRVFGGRARSFYDPALQRLIDNGTHLILSSNETVFKYLQTLNSEDQLISSGKPFFPFIDLEENKRWNICLSKGKIPWWLFSSKSNVPDYRLKELISFYHLLKASDKDTVADCLVEGQLSRRLLWPFSISVLNTTNERASAILLSSVIKQSLAKGGMKCIPYLAREGLSETFVYPALSLIKVQGGQAYTQSRLVELHVNDDRIDYFITSRGKVELGQKDKVILAIHPYALTQLLFPIAREIKIPNQFESILNIHYAVDFKLNTKGSVNRARFIGVIGGISEWIFIKAGVISVTVSAANRLTGCSTENLINLIWKEVQFVLNPIVDSNLPEIVPPHRLLWEKRASFLASNEQLKLRSSCYTPLKNLFLAGDWTETGLPSTIEGAMRSGWSAAQAVSCLS
ncbi:Hydroxysqualene dehydroxylase [Commensalibacter sp. Nvir]|uniref:hydroxysqualene dehydroxylase HpnE n=1 Tax=Commensalibacter sp. Nvir TaxID=3069817 RepID=UPI002D5A89C1|nr:Hydroxysqualene dehydroxylase [Commensalibacter sp. Nvir]